MKLNLIFVFLCLINQTSFGADYIVGGQSVGPKDPVKASTVAIYSPMPEQHTGSLCSGTLISSDIALTAAHCISQGGAKPEVIFGPKLHGKNIKAEAAEGVMINPLWHTRAGQGMDQGDIALVKFGGGLPSGYKQAPLISSETEIKPHENVTLAGYGINNAKTKKGAGVLRKTSVSVLNNRPGKSEMILDQSHGHGACHGDSGGPAYIKKNGKMVLAGLTNRSYPESAPDDCGHQVVYTKVPAYRSWINKSEKKLESGSVGDSGSFTKLQKRPRSKIRVAKIQRRKAPRAHLSSRGTLRLRKHRMHS